MGTLICLPHVVKFSFDAISLVYASSWKVVNVTWSVFFGSFWVWFGVAFDRRMHYSYIVNLNIPYQYCDQGLPKGGAEGGN